jgi:hypothetical protein
MLRIIINGEKGKAVPVRSMKAYRGIRGITPLVLNIDIRWSSSTSRTSLYLRDRSPVPIEEEN